MVGQTGAICPLCGGSRCSEFARDRSRSYLRCRSCALVFVPAAHFLTPAEEKAEYDLHRNDPGDAGYRAFLDRLCAPLVQKLVKQGHGLDFGCGPGPALAAMLREQGFNMATYDPFYAPDPRALERRYDFVTATEVVEHLHKPGLELRRLWGLLRDGGWLGIMTKLVLDAEAFSRWHYKNDATHVCFFSRETWAWWAKEYGAALEIVGQDVILLQKPSPKR